MNPNNNGNYSTSTTLNKQDESFVSLREILEKFGNNPELLNTILVAKAEQDKLKSEELRHQTELLRYESKRLEYELNNPQSPNNQAPYLLQNMSASSNNLASYNPYCLSPSKNTTTNYNPNIQFNHNYNQQHSIDPEELFIANDFKNIQLSSPPNHTSSHRSPYQHRNPSREEVLTAIRNKVRANSFAKAQSSHPMNQDITSSQESLHHHYHHRSSSIDSKLDVSSSINQFLNTNQDDWV
ncbi:hypothetical protein K502DRAFT_331192 [Neoconidiobolus thromboides FSU 785]|nr:hypothetical protein K502DRAFT_331192 [Neoconidiobolus thromboides FSU 785]